MRDTSPSSGVRSSATFSATGFLWTIEDIIQGKIWAWQDAGRRLSKRKKDELDLLRIGEAHPQLREQLPDEIVKLLREN